MTNNTPIATVTPVSEDDATGVVAEVFADIKATKNLEFVPNFWRTIAVYPTLLQQVWSQLKTVMHPEADDREGHLTPVVREMIAVAVSATNGCTYCLNSHTRALQSMGVSDGSIGEVLAVAGLFNQTNTLADGFQVEPDIKPLAARS